MTRTTPELAPPLQASAPHMREDVMIKRKMGPIHDGYSVESGSEADTLPLGHLHRSSRTSRFEGTRGIFWDAARHFDPWSDDEDDTLTGNRLSNLPHRTSGRTHD
ncbi:hypothetical protein AVEN_86080-1 [Araneus ventricosus]|uniref:Uncharacterized protein n=1 Tax=Araneus ventricosus TaxID=182803 RepID=A0A4Y2IPD9_ARAVE|nr:hypothetical protein AVEN_86080-1 [Araneus ventricosus]